MGTGIGMDGSSCGKSVTTPVSAAIGYFVRKMQRFSRPSAGKSSSSTRIVALALVVVGLLVCFVLVSPKMDPFSFFMGEPVSFGPFKCRPGGDVRQDILPARIYGSVFIGHKPMDTDSVVSSIGGAHLFKGVPALAGPINTETAFVLNMFDVPMPDPITHYDGRPICLVDMNQRTQLPPGVEESLIVGLIDHHALQGEIVQPGIPIHVDIKPWGSCATIIAHKYFDACVEMPRHIAGLLLAGIVSDTLMLRSPTTSDADRVAVERLSAVAEVPDLIAFSRELFSAKSELASMTAEQVAQSDFKEFFIAGSRVGFGVVETIDPNFVLNNKETYRQVLQQIKKARGLDYVFLGVVDVVDLRTKLIVPSDLEKSMALSAFDNAAYSDTIIDIGRRVSRKQEFIPALQKYLMH